MPMPGGGRSGDAGGAPPGPPLSEPKIACWTACRICAMIGLRLGSAATAWLIPLEIWADAAIFRTNGLDDSTPASSSCFFMSASMCFLAGRVASGGSDGGPDRRDPELLSGMPGDVTDRSVLSAMDLVAGPGIEPGPSAYEADEVPFFHPAAPLTSDSSSWVRS